jgi:hypothetical protein
MRNQVENLTVIEFSSETLRSIDITVSFIDLQAKFMKENERFTLSELVVYERKKKIKGRIDRNRGSLKRHDIILLFTNSILIALSNSNFQELNLLTLN